MKWIYLAVGAVAGMSLCSGCSKPATVTEPEKPAAEPAKAAARPERPPRVVEQPAPVARDLFQTQPVPAPVSTDEHRVSVRLCTMLYGSEGVRAGLIDEASGQSAMVREGQTFGGYEVVALDAETETALLRKDGADYTLRVTGTPFPMEAPAPGAVPLQVVGAGEPPPVPMPGDGPSLPPPDFTMPPPPRFEPLPFETERGIDPNDPKTWPADYRGPGIERAMRDPNWRMPE